MVYFRKCGDDVVYAILSQITDIELRENVLIINVFDKRVYDKLSQDEVINQINSILNENAVKCEIKLKDKSANEYFDIENFLKNEFGKYLTIE